MTSLVLSGATKRLDNAVYDLSLKSRRVTPRQDIVIVAIDRASLAREGEWPWPRRVQARLISDIAQDNPRALAWYFFFLFPGRPADDQAVHDAMVRTRTYVGTPRRWATGARPGAALGLIPQVASAATGFGGSDSKPDQDGIVRRTVLAEGPPDHQTVRMALQMARLAGRGPDPAQPLPRGGRMLIPYVGPPGAFTTKSAVDVLEGRVAPGVFRHKFVLVGATAPDMLDNYPTPMSAADGMPSVEVDANILNGLLNGSAIVQANHLEILAVSLGLIWFLLVALVQLRPRDNLWLAAAMSGLPLAGSVLSVMKLGVWVPPASYLLTLAIILPYWGWRRLNAASAYFAEELRSLQRDAGDAILTHSRSVSGSGGDVVLQQMTLLEETKRRISDLRRFVADVLANFPDPVLVVDCDGRILTGNQAANDFAGKVGLSAAPEAPLEPILARIAPLGRDTRPMWPPPETAHTVATAAPTRPLIGVGPNGRAYELRFTPTRGGDDSHTGWIVHLADITPLVSAMRQREEALQLLSHDMRSPLSAILATLDHPDFQDAPAEMRQRIEGQAGRSLELADSFVRLAKAESAEYLFEPIDLAHVLRDAADDVWSLAEAASVRITLDVRDVEEEYVVFADRGLLTRALVNLLDNAVKYSPVGKCVICRLTPTALNGRPAIACEIADSAGGMAPAALAALFSRFASARDALDGSAGIGLGLALVHTVVTRHEGTIVCESADGEGTVFTVTLPLHEEAPVHAPAFAEA